MLLIFLLLAFTPVVRGYCEEGLPCSECDLITTGESCNTHERLPYYYCRNDTKTVGYASSKYLICVDFVMRELDCSYENMRGFFNPNTRKCQAIEDDEENFEEVGDFYNSLEDLSHHRQKRSSTGSSRVGDSCSFNTDCQRGMFCGGGVCGCLSDFVAISHHCWPKINPSESGCVETRQCEAVWPGARCSSSGMCECPDETVPSRTRDGTVCVAAGIPPSCPLPEPHNGVPNPATVLANPSTHPLNPGEYMPILCNSRSNEVYNSNGGDGSTWCIYPDGDNDIYIADIYNCVNHPQVNQQLFSEYAESVDGICCHNRAFVCTQPMESGPEPSIPRWWYNSATGSCSQFMWDPDTIQGASPNNFNTAEHCESYCRDSCKRGTSEFVASKHSIVDEVPKTNCLSSLAKCGSEHSCVLFGSQQMCCPTTAHICSAAGGRTYPSKPIENFDRGVVVAGQKSSIRYYYDADQGRCVNFMYHGLGNFNNFVTKQDCEAFCSKLVCENGNPLRIGEEWQRCETNNDCPSSHTCQGSHKVCCPTSQSLCTQPRRLGDCTSSVRRYWYNAATRQCELFHYTGCQGNDNNFASLVHCQQRCRGITMEPKCPHGRAYKDRNGNFQQCSDKQNGMKCPVNYVCIYDGTTYGCCPTKAFTCSLNPEKGVQCGSGRSYRYYFNSNKQSCETFQYEGCDGNSNNFLNSEECQQYCGVGGCPNGGNPLREEGSNRQMTCSDVQTCPSTHECLTIPSNGNVASRCCPTKAYICGMSPQQGNHCSKLSVTRYYFNIITKECASFQFNGCNGNLNNFGSQTDCNNFCSSVGCGVGEIAYKDVNTKKPFDCNNILKNSCPANFQCRFNSLTSGYVCCGSTSMDVCPAGERAFINPMDESVRECAINIPGSCPANFLCRFSTQKNRYYCCAPTTDNVCPDGRALFRAAKTTLPQRCTIGVANTCSDGYTCQSRTKSVLQGYCCSTKNVCKGDAEFLVDDKTKMPKICTPGAFISCPSGYRCHRSSPASASGFCCKGEINAISEGCPPNEYAFTRKNEIVQCDPFNLQNKGCPATYSCQFAIAFQRYQCCGKDPIEEEEVEQEELGCPLSQVALVKENRPVVCTASGQSCPTGYFCQFSDKNKQFQCCGHKAGCPNESVAFIDLSGGPLECNPRNPTCPDGYSCQRSRNSRNICCTEDEMRKMIPRIGGKDVPMSSSSSSSSTTTTTPASIQTTEEAATSTETKCPSDSILTNGECKLRGTPGAACIFSTQCNTGSECVNRLCKCTKNYEERDGACEKIGCTALEVEINGKCFKLVGINDDCEADDQCQNGAECTAKGKCRCPDGQAPFKDRCLANNCVGATPCPRGSICSYSKTISRYICCSSSKKPSIITVGGRITAQPYKATSTQRPIEPRSKPAEKRVTPGSAIGVPRCPNGGIPLLFPTSNMPLACSTARPCPVGYSCLDRKCCPSSAGGRRRRRQVRPMCPRGYVTQESQHGFLCTPACNRSRSVQCRRR
ncbi:unnamed protein product [Auanema sp. JU1783]|nr:unnamed protein product [Auanema sp. JU1783]